MSDERVRITVTYDSQDGVDFGAPGGAASDLLHGLAEIMAGCVRVAEQIGDIAEQCGDAAGLDGRACGQAVINECGQIINDPEREKGEGTIRVQIDEGGG